MTKRLDPRMPPVDRSVLRHILEEHASQRPDKEFAVFDSGDLWTFRETRDRAIRSAHALRRLGVNRGDRVLSWLPNGPIALRIWFGLAYLGAVFVPINIAYRGRLLQHVIENSNASLIVLHSQFMQRLADVGLGNLTVAVTVAGPGTAVPGLTLLPENALDTHETELPILDEDIAPWDTHTIIYTSGTTGPSKGVLSSYMHLYAAASAVQGLTGQDRWLLTLPMFHVGGTIPIYRMLIDGGAVVFCPRFDTETFWSTVRSLRATATGLLGAMVGFLYQQPVSAQDHDHPLRHVTMIPYNELAIAFHKRFGCNVYTHFNMTEVSLPLVSEANAETAGSAGRIRPGVEVRIVDDNDCEVPVGLVGELIVRSDCPWALNHGYHGDPTATAEAWRNGWFHTGDAFRKNEFGEFLFVDRMKDSIRRRGENISSFEIESEVVAHPKVREVAAIGVKSELSEDEVLIAVIPKNDETIDPEELIQFLAPRLAHFMIPRYIRFMTEFPVTPTAKTQKYLLRRMGLEGDVWDRERAGMIFRREKI